MRKRKELNKKKKKRNGHIKQIDTVDTKTIQEIETIWLKNITIFFLFGLFVFSI
jgi:hypothetical protein